MSVDDSPLVDGDLIMRRSHDPQMTMDDSQSHDDPQMKDEV